MTKRIPKRLPEVKSLYEILPKGTEGGKEFARIVDLLLFHEARRQGRKVSIFSDAAGDYYGLDSFEGDFFRKEGTTGYQYKFYPSPLSSAHRKEIADSLKKAAARQKEIKLKKWILVTPQDLLESATRKGGGDVTWFENLRTELKLNFELEHWGHKKLLGLFLQTPTLCLFYYPDLTSDGETRKTIEDTRKRYNDNLETLYRNIEFVGMSVYKQEATRGVPMEHIYIPLTVVPEATDEQDSNVVRIDPIKFLEPMAKRVVLGDPGSGKSTLLRFLALVGTSKPLQKRSKAKPDKRLPILITLRRYADELKNRPNLSLIDYILESIQGDFNLKSADLSFFEFYLETGQAILLFDGLDELPSSNFKQIVRNRIRTLVTTYPGNTVLVSSRIVGYESTLRFDDKEFGHYRLTKLQLSEIKRFVNDWYQARIDNAQARAANAQDLIRILSNEDNTAIRELAENPLLLTIVALVHRIDAVLPDERVVLYLKCTETLLETWHTWKHRDAEVKNRGREERRNRRRMEAIANWMHSRSLGTQKEQRAVVPYDDLLKFLTRYITEIEKPHDLDNDPVDIACEFLEFVRRRTGLLIEVGDKQYSFVHQTFQEYLTSTYIITSNETEGIDGIWENIKRYCNDPRWLEVIRLLVAGLKSLASQEVLVEKILTEKISGPQVTKSQLIAGLLLDGVEPAELRAEEIIKQLIQSASLVAESNQLRPLLSMLRTWMAKESSNKEIADNVLHSLIKKAKTNKQKFALFLIASTLDLAGETIEELNKIASRGEKDDELVHLFLISSESQINFEQLQKEFSLLWAIEDYLAEMARETNSVAAICQAITTSLPLNIAAKRFFKMQLLLLSYGSIAGPFFDYNFSSIFIANSAGSGNDKLIAKLSSDGLPKGFGNTRRMAALSKRLKAVLGSLQTRRSHIWSWDIRHKRISGLKESQKELNELLDMSAGGGLNVYNRDWSKILSSPMSHDYIVNLICLVFNLEPRAHWWEALRASFLPAIPQRLNFFYQSEYEKLETTIADGKDNEGKIYKAAWILLFDCWLYLGKGYDSPEQSSFKRLATLTRGSDAPPLRIAHCIRDLAFGDESRKDDLIAMVQSNEPEYRAIFEGCLWRANSLTKEKPKKKVALKRSTSKSKRKSKT